VGDYFFRSAAISFNAEGVAKALRGLLNGDLGRLDGGTLDTIIADNFWAKRFSDPTLTLPYKAAGLIKAGKLLALLDENFAYKLKPALCYCIG
jgi:hypothetical protein